MGRVKTIRGPLRRRDHTQHCPALTLCLSWRCYHQQCWPDDDTTEHAEDADTIKVVQLVVETNPTPMSVTTIASTIFDVKTLPYNKYSTQHVQGMIPI